VEVDGGRARRFRVSRDESGKLVGDIEELDRVAGVGPVEPAPEATPGSFNDVFGSVEALQMLLVDALNHIIDDGIEAARLNYVKPGDTLKREGAIAGFEDCRRKVPAKIAALLAEANERARQAMREEDSRYWFWRCRVLAIEWVANVLSNVLVAKGMLPIGKMTARGRLKAAEIIGVRESRP
jgi:hypothetical protein